MASYFTPYDQQRLNNFDLDVGINGAMLLPGTNLALSGSKEGKLYLVDRTNMGGYNTNTADDSQIVQSFFAASGHMHSTPILWHSPNGLVLYIWTEQDYTKAFSFNGTTIDTDPVSTSEVKTEGMPAGILSLSADGSKAGTGIVWGTHMQGTANGGIGIVHAFDATVYPDGIMRELWNSEKNAPRDQLGVIAKFNPPMVVNGRVYVGTFSNKLVVYGLLSTAVPVLGSPQNGLFTNDNTPLFNWSGTVNTSSYRIQIDNSPAFTSPIVQDNTTSALTYQATTLADGTYYWHVRSGVGPWSAYHSFTVDTAVPTVPLLLAPANGLVTTNKKPAFTWLTVLGTQHYEMRLGVVNPPDRIVYNSTLPTYTPAIPLLPATYYWQVFAVDAAGNRSAGGEIRSLIINASVGDAPYRNYYTTHTPTLTWNKVSWATLYKIEVNDTSDFSSPLDFSATVSSTQYSTPTTSLANGVYYWHVKACSSQSVCGGWSATESFVVNGP